ncbi:hypothetical protein NPX13_g5710 [Xylaria arbuscula]|uniref:Major facilitator superfamily (MFS) profile domain-containing protein n=1 Tax=Xylaria arbuscula TaxID=114810 RepID=A0A9W8NDL8_9PEZI|nr:hypothetical protein NPX13_g5710 [Xylaria arbuscula]
MAEQDSPVDVEKQSQPLSEEHEAQHGKTPNASIRTSSAAERSLLRKQDKRIIPLSASIYFLAYLDRSNIGNAKVLNSSTHNDMMTETRTTNYQFTIALMIFLIGYFLFEVPSNILLKKFRPSRWLAFLMGSWGLITIGIGGVHNYGQIVGYKTDERSVRVAFILASATLAGAFGGAIAYGVGHLDYPETATWLSESERDLARQRLLVDGSKGSASSLTWAEAKETLMDWRLYGHYAIYFAVSLPFSSLSLFTPSIVAGLGYKDLHAQLFTVPPWAIAYVISILNSWSGDHFNARGFHCAGAAAVGAAGFLASALLPADAYASRYGTLIVGTSGAFACIPPMLGWLTSNMWSTASIGLAVALNVSIGAGLGQIPGVWIYKAEEAERGYPTGHGVNAAMLFLVAIGAICLRIFYGAKNGRIVRSAAEETMPRLYAL